MGILRIRDLNKGMALKQGDKTTLKFELYDANDDPLVLSSAGKVYFKQKGQIYAEEDVTITTENVVSFKLSTILPAGKYYIEFVVDDKVFPSQDIDTFHITSSVLGDDITVIAINGVDRVAERALALIEDDLQEIEEAELTRTQAELDRQAQEEARVATNKSAKDYLNEFPIVKSKSEEAITKATEALSKSTDADVLSKSVQSQFNQVVIDGDSSVEAAQARVDASGQTNATLKDRLDKEHNEVTTQLAQSESKKVDKDGSGQVKWANIAQDAREQISGDKVAVVDDNSIITTNLTNKSVTPDKTSFLSVIDNLYKGTYLTGVTITENFGIKTIYTEPMMANWQLAYIPIKNGESYTIRVRRKTAQTNLIVAFSNELNQGAPIEHAYRMMILREEIVLTVTNNDYKYMLIRADSGDGILQNLEVYEGDSIPTETPIIKINDVEVAKRTDLSDNLYKGTYLTGVTITEVTGVKTIYGEPMLANWQLAYVPIENGTSYTIRARRKTAQTNLFVAFSNELSPDTPFERMYDMELLKDEIVVTVTNNDYKYMLIRADSGDGILQNIEVYEGDSIPYAGPTDLSVIDNLYKDTHLTGVTITEVLGIKYIYGEPMMANWQLAYVPIKNGESYTIRASKKTARTNLFVAFSNDLTEGTPIERVYDMEIRKDEIVVTVTNDNFKYMLIRADNRDGILQNLEVYENDSIPYAGPIIKINDVEVAKRTDIDNMRDNMRVERYEGYLVTDHIDRYKGLVQWNRIDGVDTAEDIYALYDSLLADHEQYRTYRVSKNLLGEDNFGNNIYEYVFSRDTLDNHYDIRRKRIGITTTTHGIELNTTIGLFEFMKALVINKDKNEVFNRIIGSVDIHIIPVLNPSGLALWTYHNANDVDIFANFDVNWEKLNHSNKGSSPASEPETQIAQNWMQQNMFDVYFDYHRSDPTPDTNHFTWLSTDSEGPLKEEYVKTIGLLSLIKAQQYEEFPPYETFGIVKDYPHDGKSYSYANSIGSEGALLEVSAGWRYFTSDAEGGRLSVDWSKEVVGNMIMTVSRRWI